MQSNLIRAASPEPGNRPGIDFKAMDGCRDRDVSEIYGEIIQTRGGSRRLVKAGKQTVENGIHYQGKDVHNTSGTDTDRSTAGDYRDRSHHYQNRLFHLYTVHKFSACEILRVKS